MPETMPMPGGPMPSSDVITPYDGGVVRMSPEAQVAAKASQEFSSSFTSFQPQSRKHNRLDGETQNNLDELTAAMRRTRPKPAMVINLHPFELQFNADNFLLRGHSVPPCLPGMPYAYKAIRGWRHDGGMYNENGSRKFKPILPIDVAGQFAREFNKNETFGPGVIIYEGEAHPDKVGLVETYDPMGRLITLEQPGVEYDEEDKEIAVTLKVPVREPLLDIISTMRAKRNAFYLKQVQTADDWAKQQDGKARRWIQASHRRMAEILHADGVIPFIPDWSLATRVEKGLSEENCSACGNPTKAGAYKCLTCGNILDALKALKEGDIQWGHAKINLLADEQYQEALAFHEEHEKRMAQREKKAKKAS